MKTLEALKIEKEQKTSELLKACLVFFAFSNQQFDENKTKLEEGEKYVSMGAGGYLPKGKVQAFSDGMKAINKWFKDAVKSGKLRKAQIVDELHNHEAFYTWSIDDTLDALGPDFTREEVQAVFNIERKKHAHTY